MNLISLLEKNDRVQISILHYVLEHGPKVKVSVLLNDLALSSFKFCNNITCLIEELAKTKTPIVLTYDSENEIITIQKSDTANLRKLQGLYLEKSTDYQLLIGLFHHPNASVTKLASLLSLSEAAVYRKSRRLNKSLSEFKLTLKQSKLSGSLLQLIHFYFQLFWRSVPEEVLLSRLVNQEHSRFIQLLESRLNYHFSMANRLKLLLWLEITKKWYLNFRENSDNSNIQDSIPSELTWEEDPLYQIVHHSLIESLFSWYGRDTKTLTILLYQFLTSLSLSDCKELDQSPNRLWPTYDNRVNQLNDQVTQSVKKAFNITINTVSLQFIQSWKYSLTQIHTSLVYFSGVMSFFEEEYLFNHFLSITIASPNNLLAENLVVQTESFLGRRLPPIQRLLTIRNYLYFIDQMDQFSDEIITIGVHINHETLQGDIVLHRIRSMFSGQFHLNCELATSETSYDVLVTDSQELSIDYHYQHLYLANELRSNTDVHDFTALLRMLTERSSSRKRNSL